jgi:hypothetical protein
MKTEQVVLYSWVPSEDENIEIDWPKVHKTIGLDQTKWLLAQTEHQCQLIIERRDIYCRLIAEFFDDKLAVEYRLRWR